LAARVPPGATALDIQAKSAAAQRALAEALAAGAVTDLAAARSVDRRRRELDSSRNQLSATLTGLCGDDEIGQLRRRLAQLRAGQPAEPDLLTLDPAAAQAELDTAEAARTEANDRYQASCRASVTATGQLSEISTRTTVLQNTRQTQQAELDAATDRLTRERASVSDADLAAAADAATQAAQAAERRVCELAEEL